MAGLKDLARRLASGSESQNQKAEAFGRTNAQEGAMTRTTLNVVGMSCGHCKTAVEGELGKLEGVEHSEADVETGAVEVRFDEERATTDDLRGAVEKAGYTVAG